MTPTTVPAVPYDALLVNMAKTPLGQHAFVSRVSAWAKQMGTELHVSGSRPRQRGEHSVNSNDPMVAFLRKEGLVLDEGPNGAVYVECPWKHEHTCDSGPSETAWFPAGSNGYERGNFRCLHAHCAGRGALEFEQAIGYIAEDFEVLPPVDGSQPNAVFTRTDYLGIAQSAMHKLWQRNGNKLLLRTHATWYEFNGSHFAECSDEQVRRPLWQYLDTLMTLDGRGNPRPLRPNKAYVTGIIDALCVPAGFDARDVVPPCWLPGSSGPDPRDLVVLADGVLDVARRVLLPHDPRLFVTNALPFAWGDEGDSGPPTAWLAFLDSLWGEDEDAIATLQEIMGYLLTPDTSQQKMFLLIGPRRSGKGTIGRVLTALLGAHNCCAPTMASFGGEFGAAQIIGKLAAIFPDARSGGLGMSAQSVVERLLQISGEDHMEINRKNKEFWNGRPTARVVIMANEPPKLGDASGALPGRFITLSMYKSFYGQEDHGLEARLMAELPAILRWALDGRDRLNHRGHFIQPESGRDDLDDMQAMGNPVGQFITECCELDAEAEEPTDVLYDSWRNWCGKNGHHPGAKATFGRSLRVVCPGVLRQRPRISSEEKQRQYMYSGIRLRDECRAAMSF